MAVYVKKTISIIFIVGLLVLAVLSVLGLVYLSKMAYSDKKLPDGQYCGEINQTERNIARLAIILLWIQFVWIVLGSMIQTIWNE